MDFTYRGLILERNSRDHCNRFCVPVMEVELIITCSRFHRVTGAGQLCVWMW